MFKRSIMNAALAAVLGLGFGFANAQTVSEEEIDMTTGDAPGMEQQGGSDKNELKDSGAAPAQHEGQSGQHGATGQQDQAGQQARDHAPGEGGQTSQQPAGEDGQAAQQQGQTGQTDGDGAGPQATQPSQSDDATAGRSGSQQEEETTGQGQGVKDTGGNAEVKTPAESANTPADHDRKPDVVGREGDNGSETNP